MKNWKNWTILLCLQALFATYLDNSRLRWEIKISEKSKKIADDQIAELMYTNSNLNTEIQSTAAKNYTAGVVDAITKKDQFNAIWHDGYNRGENTARLETTLTGDH